VSGPTQEQRELENLRAVYRGLQQGTAAKRQPDAARPRGHAGRNTALGGALAGLVFLATKLKFLGFVAGLFKLKTLATMALSVGLYATQWGLPFALGLVLLIFVHESGHALVLWKERIPAGAPVFIPFLGAFITMKGLPRDAWVEAKVAFGGPLVGSLAAWAVLLAAWLRQDPFLAALGHVGVLINLFNLLPVSPLDGGRIAGAFTRTFWIAGYALGLAALVWTRSPLLFIVMLVGLVTLVQRWRHPVPGYDRIPRPRRLLAGLGYAALVVALAASLPLGAGLAPRAG
jgi:Zn-dependent protease